jgi:hypothetical protein
MSSSLLNGDLLSEETIEQQIEAQIDISGLADGEECGATFLGGTDSPLATALASANGGGGAGAGGSGAGAGAGAGVGAGQQGAVALSNALSAALGKEGGGEEGAGGATEASDDGAASASNANPFGAPAAASSDGGSSGGGSGGGASGASANNPFAAPPGPTQKNLRGSTELAPIPQLKIAPSIATKLVPGGGRGGHASTANESRAGSSVEQQPAGFTALIIEDYAKAPPASAVPEPTMIGQRSGDVHMYGRQRSRQTNSQEAGSIRKSMYWNYMRLKRHAQQDILADFDEKDFAEKAEIILTLPFALMRNVSIPMCDDEAWYRPYIVAMPLTAPQMVLWATEMRNEPTPGLGGTLLALYEPSVPAWVAALIFGLAGSVVVYFSTHKGHPPANMSYLVTMMMVSPQ